MSNTSESEHVIAENTYDLNVLAKKLRENEFEVKVFSTADAAVKSILQRCTGKSVGLADSATIVRSGLLEALKTKNNELLYAGNINRNRITRRKAATADVFILSANGISYETGEIVNVDSKGNRIAGSLFNPEEVIFIIGKNKIAPNLDGAIHRARNIVAPRNAKEHNYDTPCVATGKCEDCSHSDRICRVTCIFHKKPKLVNVMVVLIDENLGW